MNRKCDHAVVEQYIEAASRRGGRRIVAVCSGCKAIATRVWVVPTGDHLGWIWPEDQDRFHRWKRRQAGGRS